VRELDRPISRVWCRMRAQRFLGALVWCWTACLALVAIVLAVEKLGLPLPGPDWAPFAIAGAVGLVLAALIATITGPNRVDAAVAIDRAFHLNERLSTTLTLPIDLRDSPAGRALVADSIRHVSDLDIGSKFGLSLPRRAWVPIIPALVALGLLFIPEWTQRVAVAKSTIEQNIDRQVVTEKVKALSKKIAAQRKELDKNAFAETERLLAEIEKATNELAKSPPADKDKALIEMNKLSDALKDRQKQLGSTEKIAQQLQHLKEMANEGPADEFAKDLAKGEFQKAANELKQLQEKLLSGKMTEAEKKQLREQLAEMKQKMQQLANLEQRRKQLEEARKNGGLSQKQYEQEMAKLEQQAKSLKQLKELAQQLGQAQQLMDKGQMQKAAEALGMGQEQLNELAKQAEEIEALDGALAELQDAKNGMTGDGLNQLGRQLDGMNGMGRGDRPGRGNGLGLGRGRGKGDRPEAPDNTASYNSKVKQQYTKGKAVLEGFAPPDKQMKGESLIEAQATIEASEGINADALTNQKIPKGIQKHILNYYDQINKGK
jgi:hypothetical protein